MYELREISQQRDRIGYMNLNLCCPCSALLNSVLRLPVISVLRRLLFKARIHKGSPPVHRYRKNRVQPTVLSQLRAAELSLAAELPAQMSTSSRLLPSCHAMRNSSIPIVTSYLFKAVRGVLVLLLLPHGENKRLSDPRLLLVETERVRGDTNVPGD